MRTRSVVAVLVALAAVLLVPPVVGGLTGGGDGTQLRGLRFLVPNAPGGGYDITARTAAKAMEDAGITGAVEVFNLPGAGGTVGLGRTVNESGNDRLVMSMGLGVVGSVYTNESPATLTDTTPIARLTQETEIVVVGKDSPLRTFDDLAAAWRAEPAAVPVGGGSSPGGPDHLAPMLMAEGMGIDPRTVNYVSYDGGGELLAAVLGGKVAFGVSGLSEYADQIEAGELRVLAVTAAQRVRSAGARRGRPRRAGGGVHRAARVAGVGGRARAQRLAGRVPAGGGVRRVPAVGERARRGCPAQPGAGRMSTWLRERSELGVAALLLATGLLVLADVALAPRAGNAADPLGPNAVPVLLGLLLLLLAALLAVDVLRGGHGEAEAGEDVDLAVPADKRTVLLLAGVIVATAALIPLLGWPIAGTVLFWGATYALGSRAFPRDLLIAAGVSLATWIVFDALLGVDLPGGPLMGLI
jgi:putative tricarboxylic transport membrane protein